MLRHVLILEVVIEMMELKRQREALEKGIFCSLDAAFRSGIDLQMHADKATAQAHGSHVRVMLQNHRKENEMKDLI